MPLNVTVTKRKINNKTGIDINVPSYQKADSAKNVKYYHVVVISRLPHFKLPHHSKEDVVQFSVRRDYDAFETLQKELLEHFSDLKLPSLPRKFHLFISDSDIEERQISFDCLLMLVARTPNMATSIPVLKFLGVDLIADKKYHKKRQEYLQAEEERKAQEKKKQNMVGSDEDVDLFGGERGTGSGRRENGDAACEDGSDDDLFGEEVKKPARLQPGDKPFLDGSDKRARPKISLLDEEIEPTVLVGEEEDEDRKGATGKPRNEDRLFVDEEDHSELLEVRDSIDDILKITPGKKPKPKVSSRQPTKSTASSSLFGDAEEESSGLAAAMGTDDIMKYIEQQKQTSTNDDDLDLF